MALDSHIFAQPTAVELTTDSDKTEAAKADTLTGATASAALVGDPSQDIKINFQPNTSDVPAGYIKDIGKEYQTYSDGRIFGWVREDSLSSTIHVPLNISLNSRDRNRTGVDPRLNTLIHMQGNNAPNFSGVKIPAAWEYALPDGRYSVTVSAGDQPKYDSTHKINVEGVTAIRPFQGNSTHEYELGTVQVNVTDGRLTVDAIGGTNTKINYIEIENVSSGEHPSISGSSPDSRQIGIGLSAAVNLDVALVDIGAGVDATTLTTDNIQLYRTKDNTLVPGNINTTGGGDAIVYQPGSPLEISTHYTFRLGDGVKDESGNPFLPFSTTFSTGTTTMSPTPGVNFNKSVVYSGATISSLTISPNGKKLYAASLDGKLRRWSIDSSSGSLTNLQTFSGLAGRAIIGMTFDPQNASVLWLSHNDPLFPQPANDFTGKISQVQLNTVFRNSSVKDYVVGLPRSAKDHLSNGLNFGPDGKLYMTQGSNSAMGAPDNAWYQRPERLLTAAVLQIAPRLTAPTGGFNVQTEDYTYTDSAGQTVTTTGNYNPYTTNAPVKIYATGVRNAYDLVWHRNGSLYVPTNGSAAGGKTPDNPNTTDINEALTNVGTQNDYFFKVVKDGYYGHPNPTRSEYKLSHSIDNPDEYILNGGNPTSGKDLAEVVDQGSYNGYDIVNGVGIQPEAHWQGFAYDFGRNRSPNGVIEYKSNTFNGALKNQLLVVEYSGGDDILALKPDANANLPSADVTQAAAGLINPLDLIENTLNGNLYVAELVNENTGKGQITLLSPNSSSAAPLSLSSTSSATPNIAKNTSRLIFNDVQGGAPSAAQTVKLRNTGDSDLTISGLKLSGTNANQFQINNPPTVPLTITPGGSTNVSIAFNPTTAGPKGSLLQIQSNDPDRPQTTVTLRGLGTLGLGGSKEPSLQWILDTYQIPDNVGDPDPTNNAMPATGPLGDEVSLPRFQKAGPGPVTVQPIAVFGPKDSTSGIVARFGYYTSGNAASQQELFSVRNASYQSLNPAISGSKSFDPGTSSFGFYSSWPFFNNRAVYSEDDLNTFANAIPHHVRVYPFKKSGGPVVPNAYVVAMEENTSGFDYQDIAVIVRNIKPTM